MLSGIPQNLNTKKMKVVFVGRTDFKGTQYQADELAEFEDLNDVRELVLAGRVQLVQTETPSQTREKAVKNPERETR